MRVSTPVSVPWVLGHGLWSLRFGSDCGIDYGISMSCDDFAVVSVARNVKAAAAQQEAKKTRIFSSRYSFQTLVSVPLRAPSDRDLGVISSLGGIQTGRSFSGVVSSRASLAGFIVSDVRYPSSSSARGPKRRRQIPGRMCRSVSLRRDGNATELLWRNYGPIFSKN